MSMNSPTLAANIEAIFSDAIQAARSRPTQHERLRLDLAAVGGRIAFLPGDTSEITDAIQTAQAALDRYYWPSDEDRDEEARDAADEARSER